MNSGPSQITRDEAKHALLRSGYLLEQRLEGVLRNEGYYVDTNAAYPDPETAKSRELDLYALSARKAGPKDYDFLFPVLLIECVNNPQPLALITKEPVMAFMHREEIKLAGLPVKIRTEERQSSWSRLPEYLAMEKYHHYCKGRVATQFCSFQEKKKDREKEWMATHDEAHFDAFRKLSAVTDYHVRKHFASWTFGGPEYVNIELYYPVLVVQGELFEVYPRRSSVKIKEGKHLQYRRSAIVDGEEITYQIDVITEQYFPNFLEVIEKEVSKTARLLRRRHPVVRKSLERIVRTAKRFRTPAKIRSAMDL